MFYNNGYQYTGMWAPPAPSSQETIMADKTPASRPYPRVIITPKAEKSARKGHPWIYDTEITDTIGVPENGALTDVYTQKNRYVGTGFFNDHSKIRVRIITTNANDRPGEDFWVRRVKYAVDYRRTVMGEDFSACRLIFGEADGFPGLTVDRFNNVLSVQCLSLGIELRKDIILPAIVDYLRSLGETIDAVYERNDAPIRRLEGMEEYTGYYRCEGLGEIPGGKTIIEENGIRYTVDFVNGQKTGFFLDQKYNRLAAARLAKGKNVLDCFTYTGTFGLNAAYGGAAHVTSVDISRSAIDAARANAEMNGLADRVDYVCADVFDYLTQLAAEGCRKFDYIILDPPAFTKSSSTIKNAERGYKEINLKAMKLLPRGGYLATCSCSHFMTDSLFCHMLHDAAADAGVSLRQIEARQQAPDHPILWNVPETDYLKFYLFQVI